MAESLEERVDALAVYLTLLVRGMVSEPGLVIVTPEQRPNGLYLHINCGKPDVGRLIGKSGLHARSLRTIMCAAARLIDLRAELVFPE